MKHEVQMDLGEFLKQRNPLALKDKKGQIMVFDTYKEAYEEFFWRIYQSGPYYVDLVLLSMEIYGMTKPYAEKWVRTFWALGIRQDVVLLDWGKDKEDKLRCLRMNLEQICICFHTLVGSKFQRDMFLAAFNDFMFNLNTKKK